MADVLIFGCGWLGTQLGTELAGQGHHVWGSRRSPERLAALPGAIQPMLWDGVTAPVQSILDRIAGSWLILAMPPAAARDGGVAYLATLRMLVAFAGAARGLILCSSTSVYAGCSGLVGEGDAPGPDARAQLIWQAEQVVLQHPRSVVLRLAGLVGPGRHPAVFTRSGQMAGPDLPVNLVHSADICAWVGLYLANSGVAPGRVINLCAPLQQNKRQFYTAACHHLGWPVPQFMPTAESARQINAQLSLQLTPFCYQYHEASLLCAASSL